MSSPLNERVFCYSEKLHEIVLEEGLQILVELTADDLRAFGRIARTGLWSASDASPRSRRASRRQSSRHIRSGPRAARAVHRRRRAHCFRAQARTMVVHMA